MKYVLAFILLLSAAPAFADCEWGTSCYQPAVQGPQCRTVFVMGQGYQQVCQ